MIAPMLSSTHRNQHHSTKGNRMISSIEQLARELGVTVQDVKGQTKRFWTALQKNDVVSRIEYKLRDELGLRP